MRLGAARGHPAGRVVFPSRVDQRDEFPQDDSPFSSNAEIGDGSMGDCV